MIVAPLISIKNRTRGRKNAVMTGLALLIVSNVFITGVPSVHEDR